MRLIRRTTLAGNFSWVLAGQGIGYFLRLVYFILIARLLGVVQYGIIVGAYALVNMVAQYSRLGTGTVFLRYVSADHKQFAVYWGNIIMVTLCTTCFLLVLLQFFAPHLIDPQSAGVVILVAIGSCFCEQLIISATQAFQAFERMPTAAALNLLTSLVRALTAEVMLLRLHHATARQWAVASMAAMVLATAVALSAVSFRFGLPRLTPRLFLKRGGEGLEYAFAASTSLAYDDLDKAMLSHYGMNAAAGVYAMAYRIIEMATVPIASIQMAAEPRLFQLGASGIRESARLGHRLMSRALPVSLVISALLYGLAPVIPHVLGNSFSQGVSALRWLCLIPVFRCVHYITGSVLTCSGQQRYRTGSQLAAALLNFCLNLWLIPRHGWLGAAWASLITDCSLGLMNWGLLTLARTRPSVSLQLECS